MVGAKSSLKTELRTRVIGYLGMLKERVHSPIWQVKFTEEVFCIIYNMVLG